MRHIALLALALLAGCQTAEVRDEAPEVRVMTASGHALVCLTAPGILNSAESWQAACAAHGPWMPCIETEKTLDCSGGRSARRVD